MLASRKTIISRQIGKRTPRAEYMTRIAKDYTNIRGNARGFSETKLQKGGERTCGELQKINPMITKGSQTIFIYGTVKTL